MTEPEGLGPRSHGEIKRRSTLGTTHRYVDERLPFPRRGRERSYWRTVERQDCSMSSTTQTNQVVTHSFPCGAHLHRMDLRGSNDCTLCQRARNQRADDQHEGCERIDPETLGHIQSAHCVLQARVVTSTHHHFWQQVQWEMTVVSSESKGWTFLTLEGEKSMQTCW